jgi:diguanylate cyclase (GGDEF)-like protein/PAS domain S-box-containing protein
MADPIIFSEAARISALDALGILDTSAEARFDRFTRLAALTFGVPIALISLVGENRQWFKSRCGVDVQETPRSLAFCSHTVAQRDMLVVEDTTVDPRFADHPFVTAEPHVRFYAGQPVYSDGHAVGTLCVVDCRPRVFSNEQRQCLRDLAELVEAELNHVKVTTARLMAEQALKALNTTLEQRVSEQTAELKTTIAELSREITRRDAAEVSLRQTEAWNRTIVAASYSGFIGADQDGRIIEWNDSAERIFGWKRAEANGQRLSELIVPVPLRAGHDDGMKRYLETDDGSFINRKVELPALTASGRQITVEMTLSVYEWKGQRCFGAFLNDISERIRTQQQLEEKQELLDAVLESIDVAVVACDAVGNLSLFNRAARVAHGSDMAAIAPAEWSRYYSLYHADGRTPLTMDEVPLIRTLKGETVRDQTVVIAPMGSPARTMLASGRSLRSESGRALGAVVALKDITELNASRDNLAVSESRLRAITENLPAMIGKVNAAQEFVFLNGRALKTFGKTSEELIGQDVKLAYSPEEFAEIEPYIEQVVAGEPVFFEYAAKLPSREIHYQCSFVPQRLPNGQPDGFFAMAFDISERKLSELRQAESEERLRTITDNVPVLIAHLDERHRYSFANAIHQSWLGKAPQQILGQTMQEAFGTDYYSHQAKALAQAWNGQASQCEHEIVRKKHIRIVHSTFLPQMRNGIVTGVYILTTDATVSRMHERNLHALAHTDTLTSLPNRRHFETTMRGAVGRQGSADRKIALLYLDIDHFKQINDTYGHATGDAVLVEFARRLRASVRGSDLVARLAGDEFTVLLNDVSEKADVEQVARKILASIVEPFLLEDCTLQVGTTIGAAIADAAAVDAKALTEVADRALYLAKDAGRGTYAIINLGYDRTAAVALATA